MTDVTGAYPGRPAFYLLLRVVGNAPNGWVELYAVNPNRSSSTFSLDCLNWSVTVSGNTYTGCHSLDFRGGQEVILLASFAVGLAVGANPIAASHGGSVFGVASTSGTHYSATTPPAPTMYQPSQVTTTSMLIQFQSTGDGGSPITAWRLERALDAAFTQGLVVYSSSGTTQATGLTPGTRYYWRAYGSNALGSGPWSNTVSEVTLPAVPPGMTVTPNLSGTNASVALTPPSGVSSVTSYRVERRPIGGVATVYNTPTSPLVVTGLTPGSVNEWRASAFIGTYQTPWTDWVTISQPQPNTNPGDYFDGSTPDKTDIDYQWNGTTNNSTSRAVAKAPLGWRTFAAGNALSGGLGAVIRATGGRSGAFGARVTFFTDCTTARFRAGTALLATGAIDVAEGGVYWGSIYVAPSKSQRMAAELIWLDAAYAPIGTAALGVAQVVPANPLSMVRLVVQGTAPLGAVKAAVGWTDVTGTGWSLWQGGDTVMMDDAMASIGELYDWFSGDTPDSAFFSYDWLGVANASVSQATAIDAADVDPLADPDCPPIPSAPTPPIIADDCLDEVGAWRRYWAVIPADQMSDWLDVIPTTMITTGPLPARQVRIRTYPNPDNLDPSVFPAVDWQAEQIVSFIPANTVLTIDGVAERVWAEVSGGVAISADRLLYGTGGGPASWPVLSCGTAYLVSFDVPLDAPEGNLSIDVALTTRML